jgi:hypothetical protein
MYRPPSLILFDGKWYERDAFLCVKAAREEQVEIARLEFENRILRAWLYLKEEDDEQPDRQ